MTDEDELPRRVAVSLITPGGVACREYADGALVVRACHGHVDADDGLLAEMRSGREPLPWASMAARDDALAHIGRADWLDGAERGALRAHVLRTPYYEADR